MNQEEKEALRTMLVHGNRFGATPAIEADAEAMANPWWLLLPLFSTGA